MKRWLLGLILFASCYVRAEDKQLPLTNFSGGLNSYFSPLTIKDNEVKEALNGLFDEDNAFTKRKGYTNCGSSKTYSYDSGWDYVDANSNDWLIVRSSDAIIASASPCTFTVVIATLTATDVVNAVNAFGRIYFVHRSSGVFYWDGTTTTYIPGSPRGQFITEFRNRLWVGGLNVPTGNYLYASKYLDGSTWATGSLSTDPLILQIGLNDNQDSVTGLFAGYNDALIVFKLRSIFGIFGFDQTDFAIRALNKEVGTIDQRSIQPYLGGIVFASQRGFEFFDGASVTLISKNIKNMTDASGTNSFNSQTWTQQLKADWDAGTLFNLNSTVAQPSLVLSTGSAVDTNAADFAAGTLSNGVSPQDTMISGGSVVKATDSVSMSGGSFNSTCTNWSRNNCVSSAAGDSCTVTPQSASYMAGFGTQAGQPTLTAELQNCGTSAVLQTTNVGWVDSCTWTARTLAGQIGVYAKIKLYLSVNPGTSASMTSDCFVSNGDNITFYTASNFQAAGSLYHFDVDDIINGVTSTNTGFFTSRVFDTGISSVVVKADASYTINTESISFSLLTSSASPGTFTNISYTTGTSVNANRYLQYKTTFTVGGAANMLTSLDSMTLSWTASSGTFKSQIRNTGAVVSWGTMAINDTLNGGNIVYSICSSTNSNMGYPASCAAQTGNAQINVSTGNYVQWYATFTVTATTQTPTLSLGSVQWYTGTRSPLMASAVYDNRYWVSLSTITDSTSNTGTLVLTKGPVWTLFDIKAGAFILRQGKLYHTNNSANGKVYLDWQGYNDDGAAINSYVRSKDYMPEGWMIDKVVKSLHILAEPLGVYTLSSSYELDRSGTFYSFDDITVDELSGKTSLNLYVPKSTSYAPYGRSLSIKFGNNVVDEPMKVYGGNLVYSPRIVIQ